MAATGAVERRGPERNGSSLDASGNGTATVRPRVTEPVALPPARRPSAATLAGLAAVAAVAAVGLGAVGVVSALDRGPGGSESADADARRAVALLSKPSTERVPLRGSERAVVLAVGSEARGFLVLRGLATAPTGKAYEAWVVRPGRVPLPAAVFSGSKRLVELSRRVPPGATVGVSLENEVGSESPTEPFLFAAQRP
jgi:hypothetical protein